MKKRIFTILSIISIGVMLSGCGGHADRNIQSYEDLNQDGVVIGVPAAVSADKQIHETWPKAKIAYYSDLEGLQAVSTGKIDCMIMSGFVLRTAQKDGMPIRRLEPAFRSNPVVIGISPKSKIPDLEARVNEFVDRVVDDGTVERLEDKWLVNADYSMPEYHEPESPDLTIHVGTSAILKPFTFIDHNDFAGLDIELSYALGDAMNAKIIIEQASYDALLMGLKTGKYDVVLADLYWTEERAQSAILSKPYHKDELGAVVQSDDAAGIGNDLSEKIYRSLVEQDRYKTIAYGIGITLVITIFGFLLANVLGILFCYMQMAKVRWLRIVADVYSKIMQGTPIVVVLMILFYIIFGSSNISGVFVSILAFGLSTGAYLAQTFYGAINGIDKGQWEAGLALGFTSFKTLKGIILPQAIVNMLPGYFSELIALMKGTAIVGYVAVVDLTKAGDLIRAATFEPLVPLLIAAIVYFAISTLLLVLMKMLLKRIDPKLKKRQVKGVVRHD